ncbi:cyclin-dependent protein kinase [Yamadazyma tenuis]|uniref:Cyclin-dependent kinase 8 n=1 Tax=Candida tenuis (strain ATCC 10573 / BCRC 21748 / CBS 615 / JCM 9827 / NBRC 10315 / NRRL Y-1498 / VKM Y-70) TaxID=590646 RepID=G3B7T5_CANTC|nr:kinase-like protein [Yamadazyma tenuis ATCC 10573]EGV62317.1 kinase-like protein [Yamadazyma tenuis ATCC 10573]WEJ93576.1 cyclin-dependent protein kinase [Yamadazyma tenuis]
MNSSTLMASNSILTLGPYKHRKDLTRESVLSKYEIVGYIAAGTYGKVYKARSKLKDKRKPEDDNLVEQPVQQLFAIKKFKIDNNSLSKNSHLTIDGQEVLNYTGISQSAIREMSLCKEITNKNVIKLIDIILENKSIYMIFEYCEHDLLQIIHNHSHPELKPIPLKNVKSLIWQILNGVLFLHKNWIFHRDLKPANIMVTNYGTVKIGDLGLARKFNNPLQSLYTGDKVVVTIWYRAPELLMGARYYTPAIDLWAVGCILAELLSLRPIFKGEEAKFDINNKKSVPFQKNQFLKIIEILGVPNEKDWSNLSNYPEYYSFKQMAESYTGNTNSNLLNWYKLVGGNNKLCYKLLESLLLYDPSKRITAENALMHEFFMEAPKVDENAFDGLQFKYPKRRIFTEDNDIVSNNITKRVTNDDGMRKKIRQ